MHKNTNVKILKSIRCFTGSQCSFSKSKLMWSWSRVRVTNHAAEFWILCNFWMSLSGRPYKIPWQKSRWETIWAWTSLYVDLFERKGRIVPILCKANDATLQIWFTWADNVKCSSSRGFELSSLNVFQQSKWCCFADMIHISWQCQMFI